MIDIRPHAVSSLTLCATLLLSGAALAADTAAPSKREMAAIQSSIDAAREISRRAEEQNGLPYRRDAHAKATGCTRAIFSVNGDIPEQFQHGVFTEPGKEYQAWVRFSNGDMLVQPDGKGDARGMAIKLMNVDGTPIAPELHDGSTQDFIMTNYPVFFNRDIYDYADDIQYLAKFQRTKWFISLFPPRLHPRRLFIAAQTVSSKIGSPLEPQYYSMLPYRLGDSVVKFSARACSGMTFDKPKDTSDPDYLTHQMADTLGKGGACFDFMVQPKVAGAYMPIDDATVEWDKIDSPFIPIARVRLPPQTITAEAQQSFCENLSMNPWHAVEGWQPLSSLNRARRVVYQAVSEYRHDKNMAPITEPDNWCVEGAGEACSDHQGLIVTEPKWPLPRCFDSQYQPVSGDVVDTQCW
ncbi:catalase family protein [Marinobacterium sp. D7]|uniref:catalase family protein n=1 Tax=Marinobacterium ramblicola TaxID=2849041 RepID=UPI001C2D58E2|nr:catalase family protein [Marinobacterium ramblicola]MBV1786766.1 catalase family protein [Marinobacterium ramblicola]